jgi:hypothetical protein
MGKLPLGAGAGGLKLGVVAAAIRREVLGARRRSAHALVTWRTALESLAHALPRATLPSVGARLAIFQLGGTLAAIGIATAGARARALKRLAVATTVGREISRAHPIVVDTAPLSGLASDSLAHLSCTAVGVGVTQRPTRKHRPSMIFAGLWLVSVHFARLRGVGWIDGVIVRCRRFCTRASENDQHRADWNDCNRVSQHRRILAARSSFCSRASVQINRGANCPSEVHVIRDCAAAEDSFFDQAFTVRFPSTDSRRMLLV